ncbi:MAG: geranylgeranylglyceryl/heptaprenylglyceryl phosphate synthase [Flavobacteriaceae bacterium]|nr:geranylgeranylglyceryl/heptaprenylglyceryl phosphate synthase [Flavobacteriaceae bacterium]
MKNILEHIKTSKEKGQKLLAILLDPDKLLIENIEKTINKINRRKVDFIFVGGSTVSEGITELFVKKIKELTQIPIVLFPGDFEQITDNADALLFLSLLSGRNPEYLIGQQIKSVKKLQKSSLEIIPTGYILIDGGVETSVEKVSNTTPILQSNIEEITATAIAGEYLGKQLIYLEAGSGATVPTDAKIISSVANSIQVPLIVGGGIRTKKQLQITFENGADLVVIGTAFEENNSVLTSII